MRLVCRRSSSKLRISPHTKLKDAATLSWMGLVKEVLPSTNGAVASLSPAEGRTALQTIVLPRISGSSSSRTAAAAEQQSSRAAEQQQQQCSNSSIKPAT